MYKEGVNMSEEDFSIVLEKRLSVLENDIKNTQNELNELRKRCFYQEYCIQKLDESVYECERDIIKNKQILDELEKCRHGTILITN